MELRELLTKYKEISLKLAKSIEEDDDNGELLIKEREDLIGKLKALDFSKDDFKKITDELELVEIEKRINDLILISREKVKREMLEIQAKRNANRTYGADFKNVSFINKRI